MTHPKLKLYNTLTREKQDFVPIDAKNVGLYVCGVTPYDFPHIGNARPMVAFDILFRLLRHVYGEKHVTYVRNFTDVDDKIIARAAERKTNPMQLAQYFIMAYHEDSWALNCLMPTHEPLVSDPVVMQGIVSFIEKLIEKGAAYVISDGVYLDIAKIESMKDKSETYSYGKLSGKKLDELIAGARVDVNLEKRQTGDFALWKFAKVGEPAWFSPWGEGRPGWHIECSVMSEQLLGNRFDIHGGGEDLQFPHHENELAQSVSCHGHMHAGLWMHNAFITVEGNRMGKSMGNFIPIKDVRMQLNPLAIRLWLLQTHYRKPVDYSEQAMAAANKRLAGYQRVTTEAFMQYGATILDTTNLPEEFVNALADDLNTSVALSVIDKEADALRKTQMLAFVGLIKTSGFHEGEKPLNMNEEALMKARITARTAKNWPESDRLRDLLKSEHGIIVEDGPNGQTWRRA
jgi:cysteinyl-tRNA synthetase